MGNMGNQLPLIGKNKPVRKYYSSEDLFGLVAKKYPSPAWIVLAEVRSCTGYATRSADAVAFGVWPSRGFQIIGFEFKSNRSDWKRELASPSKADAIGKYCDQWWIVATDDIVQIDEVPKTWGWFAPKNRGLRVMKKVEDKEPEPLTHGFMMSVIRGAIDGHMPKSDFYSQIKKGIESGIEQKVEDGNYELKQLHRLKDRVQEFRKESGINIDDDWKFPVKKTGRIVRAVLETRLESDLRSIKRTVESLEKIIKEVKGLPFMPKDDDE